MSTVSEATSPGAGKSAIARWYIVILLSLLSLASFLDRFALNLLVDPLRADLGLSDTQIGLLIGPAFSLFYAFMAFPAAYLVDKGNRKWLAVCGVVVWAFCTAASGFTSNFEWLLLCRAGVGVGEAVLTPVAISMIGDLFKQEHRPTPTGFFLAMSAFGASFSFIAAAAIIDFIAANSAIFPQVVSDMASWRLVLITVALPALALAPLLALTTREPPRGAPPQTPIPAGTQIPVAANTETPPETMTSWFRMFGFGLVGSAVVTILSYSAMAWFPTYLMRNFGLGASDTGYLFGVFALVGAALGPFCIPALSEFLARKWGKKDAFLPLVLLAIPVALAAFSVAVLAPTVAFALIAMSLYKAFSNGASTAGDVLVSIVGHSRIRGRLVAIRVWISQILGASGGPLVVSLLSEHVYDGDLGLSLLTVALVVLPLAFVLYLLSWKPYRDAVYQRS